jgi:hypothetical protein
MEAIVTTKGVFGRAQLHQFISGAAEAVPNTQNPRTRRSEAEARASSIWRSERRGASPASLRLPCVSQIGF